MGSHSGQSIEFKLPDPLYVLQQSIEEQRRFRGKGRGKNKLSSLTPLFRQSSSDFQSQNPRISPASTAVLLNQIAQDPKLRLSVAQ
jgi:hypothetical protein